MPIVDFCSRVIGESHGRDWSLYNGDSVEVIQAIPDASVGLAAFSPPFGNLYIYSDSVADMGNSADHEEFAEHYSFLVRELLRVVKPGRLCVVHCKDLPLYKNRDGSMGLYPFPSLLERVHLEAGWILHSRVTIWKDPVTEMQRTKNHGLLYKELCKDSCGSRQGMADYLLVFRNWNGEFRDPVHAEDNGERFDHYVGTDPPDPTTIANEFGFAVPTPDKWGRMPKRNPFPPGSEAFRVWSIKCWQKYASPVWMDIDQMNTLNEAAARESADCKHICPLQLDVIERAIHLWTNPGDVVFSPFAGIGSELYCALKTGRKAMGVELKGSYFETAAKYLGVLEKELNAATLF
jgi:DNA modification methylase